MRAVAVLLLAISAAAVVATIITFSQQQEEEDTILAQGDSDIKLLYGHHPFLKMKPESNVFADLPVKSHGKYKTFVPEKNVFGALNTPKMNVKKQLKLWVIPGHKYHKGFTDSNVLAKPNKIYKWHKGKGRSDDVNVLDGFDYSQHDPAYDSEYEIPY